MGRPALEAEVRLPPASTSLIEEVLEEEDGRDEDGRANPVMGRPDWDTGRTIGS
jgi:hypothetical protein